MLQMAVKYSMLVLPASVALPSGAALLHCLGVPRPVVESGEARLRWESA